MSRIAYVNGSYMPHREGAVHIEDRGYQFADSVYEVVTVLHGSLIDEEPHLDRLERSLSELDMAWPLHRNAMKVVLRQVVRRNHLKYGIVYFQVTRGVAPRNFEFPANTPSSLVVTAKHIPKLAKPIAPGSKGLSVITLPDIRWKRRDIKTTGLLAGCLAKQKAVEAGVQDAWLVDEAGYVTEGTSNNAWIVTRDGELITRDISNDILNGITRRRILKIAQAQGLKVVERAFTPDEVKQAREAFISSASSFVKPVTEIDGKAIGNAQMGELSEVLLKGMYDFMETPQSE
ncbi:MAG: D-amino-acid transaminase [Rhodospirillales bacterium]|jgi:D-alanine transaminase|nr:D-amino-acid transaminase [Rhodospirillales bacterium]